MKRGLMIPAAALAVAVSREEILAMRERDRPALNGSARLDPDEKLHAGCVSRVADRLERAVVPVRIGPPVAGHDTPVALENGA